MQATVRVFSADGQILLNDNVEPDETTAGRIVELVALAW